MSGSDIQASGATAASPAADLPAPEARGAGLRKWAIVKIGLLLLAAVFLPPYFDDRYLTTILISVVFFGILGAIYDLMVGYAGLNNFGFAGVLAIGSYASALCQLNFGTTGWEGLLIGGTAAGAIGLLTGIITLRLRGLYLGLMTFFVGETIRLTISNLPQYTRGTLGLTVAPFENVFGIDFARGADPLNYYYLLLLLGAAIMIFMHWLVRSKAGLVWRALKEDETAARTLRLRATRWKLLNFTIASFLTGVMGSFYAHNLGVLSPLPTEFGVGRTVEVLTVAYVGGRGTLWGSFFAAALLIGIQEYFRGLGAWRLVLFGVLLILVMIFVPKGLARFKRLLL